MNSIFVYGTLKRGYSRSATLISQRFVATALTLPDYRMYRVADYPGLVEVKPGTGQAIAGEIYLVDSDCLKKLDEIEAIDVGLYERRSVRIDPVSVRWEDRWRNARPIKEPLSNFKILTIESTEAYYYLHSVVGLDDCGSTF